MSVIAVIFTVFAFVAGFTAAKWWYGSDVAAERARVAEDHATNLAERERLTGWAHRLVAREAFTHTLTARELSIIENSRSVFDQDQQELAEDSALSVDDSPGGSPVPSTGAIPWGPDSL